MRIPTKFTLGAVAWKVETVEHLPELQGRADARSATILIEKNPNKTIEAQTFCHELIHAFLFSSGRPEDHDEVMVDGIAHYLHQYLVQVYDKEGVK